MVRSRPARLIRAFSGGHGLGRKTLRLEVVIKILVLAKNHGIVDRHSLEEHAIGVLDRGRRHDDQTGIMGINGLHALAMEGAAPRGAAKREADGERTGDLRAPKHGGRLIHDLVEAHGGEVGELHLNDRAHPLQGGSDRRSRPWRLR